MQFLSAFDLKQFEKSPSPMCIFDSETRRCLAVNDAALRLFGYSQDEFLGVSLEDIRHPAEDTERGLFSGAVAFPRHFGTRRHLKKSGDVFIADVVAHDIEYEERAAVLMLLLETTERARSHTRWLEREQLFSALVEHSPDVIARIDRELRHVYINPAVSQAAGITPEHVIGGKSREQGVPLELCVRWAAGARRAFATGKQQEIEITFPTAEGERCYVSHMVPEMGADGRVETVLAVARDVTARKQAELALRASERKLRETQREFEALADGLPQMITRYDRNLRCTYANAALERATGIARQSAVGRVNGELGIPATLVETWDRQLRTVFDSGEPSGVEFEYAKDDETRCYEAHYIPLKREDGEVDSVICVSHDVTERKRAEEDRVSFVSRQRDAFVREVHHRVKNNLQGVVGLLRQLGSMEAAAKPLLDKAVSQLQAMAVVHGLHGRDWRDSVLLHGLVEEIAQSVERTSGVSVTYDGTPCDEPLNVRETDAVAVALVVNELISNAAKHGRGDVAVSVDSNGDATAQVRIVNRGALPVEFDFNQGKGLGTGLDLVQTLLPRGGAHVAISQEDDRVEAVVNLQRPVLEHGARTVKEMPHAWDRRKRPYSDRRR